MLGDMRGRVRKIGIISNTSRTSGDARRRLLAHFGLTGYFDSMVFSDEIGWRKPDPRIFAAAAKALQTPIGEILHVGDNPVEDAGGAENAGMETLLLENPTPSDEQKLASSVASSAMAAVGASAPFLGNRIRTLGEVLTHLSR